MTDTHTEREIAELVDVLEGVLAELVLVGDPQHERIAAALADRDLAELRQVYADVRTP